MTLDQECHYAGYRREDKEGNFFRDEPDILFLYANPSPGLRPPSPRNAGRGQGEGFVVSLLPSSQRPVIQQQEDKRQRDQHWFGHQTENKKQQRQRIINFEP